MFDSLQKLDNKEFEANPDLALMLIPDITIFVNLWLTIGAFAAMQPNYAKMNHMGQGFKTVCTDLIKLFNNNPRWKSIEFNLREAANVSVALTVLKVGNEKFIGDICDIIRMKINDEAEP